MSGRITERSLYGPISDVLKEFGVHSVSEISIRGERFPDLVAEVNGHKFLIEVKINTETKLLDDIPKAIDKARRAGIPGMAVVLLFPKEVKDISPDLLHEVAPRLKIKKAVAFVPWISDSWRELFLEDFARRLVDKYRVYVRTQLPTVNYDIIVDAAREAVVEIASIIRRSLVTRYLHDAMAIVGRFDIYRATLKDFEVDEEEMKAWIADIAAYLTVNQILFYHILSQKTGKYPPLPDVRPLEPDRDLIDKLNRLFSLAAQDYQPVFGPNLLPIIKEAGELNSILALGKFIVTLRALRPEYVKAELLGRLYQESIPPETRKNLGAFFTKPKAAAILARLAIDRWDEQVLDPACGSGTLLTEAYRYKRELAPPTLGDEELHRKLLSDIYGIDVMCFAHHMTSINLLAQNITIPAELEHIRAGDGLEPMIRSTLSEADDPPSLLPTGLREWIESVRPESLPYEGFDVVIMNPPFTRRERLSEIGELDRLDKLFSGAFEGEVVRGKVGYWAYFMAAADKMIKPKGKLAMVTPEEFFAGGGAESLRRFLFFRQIYSNRKREYIPIKEGNVIPYSIECVIRSGVEVAFSEAALYRDYLVVFKKIKSEKPMIFVILKKPLNEIDVEEITNEIKIFSASLLDKVSTENLEAIKVKNISSFIEKHISNLKPLVGFNSIKAQNLFLELIDRLSNNPTLKDLDDMGVLSIRVYNPGQYRTRGVEDEARKLFASKYGARGKILFDILGSEGNKIILKCRVGEHIIKISKENTIPSLRTSSGVKHFNITNEEECAIIEPNILPKEILIESGLRQNYVNEAANDIKQAYKKLSSNILLARRLQIPSTNLYWLAFYSQKQTLSTAVLINARSEALNANYQKILTLYLNSSISLMQILGFAIETRGAWVDLHGDQVWKNIHIPLFDELSTDVYNKSLNILPKIDKIDVEPLFDRFINKNPIQRMIDEIALEMLGLDDWKSRLDDIYEAIIGELQAMLEILEKSKKPSKRKTKIKKRKRREEFRQLTLPST